MRGERWALISVKLVLLFLRACSRQPVFARLFSCAECTRIRSRRPVYTRSFSPAHVCALTLTPGTSHSPRARCSQSRFSCAGPFRASLFARWSFAASLFACWDFRSLTFRVQALSRPRFSRTGTFAASLYTDWHFAASLFACWLLRGLAFRALAPSQPRLSHTRFLHFCSLGKP